MYSAKHQQMSLIGWATADLAFGGAIVLGMCGCTMFALWMRESRNVATLRTMSNRATIDLDAAREKLNAIESHRDRVLADLEQARTDFAKRQHEHRQRERVLRQELLGIQGSMQATVFVVDISGSVTREMNTGTHRPNWGGDGSPWGFIRNQVKAWVRHLPVERFRIIAFNHDCTVFPSDSRWASRESDAESTTAFLSSLQPNGTTNTEQALELAASWQPSNIVLITDGAPSNAAGKFDPAQIERILTHVRSDDFQIPVNVIAVNNYFDREFGTFLQRLAGSTGGSFIGL